VLSGLGVPAGCEASGKGVGATMDSGAADRRQGGNGPAHLDGKPVLEHPKPPPAAAPGGKTKYGLQFGGADGSGMGKKGTEEKRGGRSSCGGRD
jgi:hypothetical protein